MNDPKLNAMIAERNLLSLRIRDATYLQIGDDIRISNEPLEDGTAGVVARYVVPELAAYAPHDELMAVREAHDPMAAVVQDAKMQIVVTVDHIRQFGVAAYLDATKTPPK